MQKKCILNFDKSNYYGNLLYDSRLDTSNLPNSMGNKFTVLCVIFHF